ncbi:Nop14-like protein [Corynespora cassiicola Philippines]|uniref:Nop14-like protein n=1 Tax=Corynespora cassiicola Philippines TaxID=1448308 RepID=A0A2T2ND72_CORCC|nr:Nop14-like protein [Corynespora cassiicola Philippines]
MPPSQLKRLKASLREQGITGPQKSKKQKKSQSKNAADQHAKKAAALASIRESLNPFEVKQLARPKKFEYATAQSDKSKVLGRPGASKSQGEETRRKTLLPELNRKHKVGGILDRRIGEDDPSMSLDDRMMARFEQEQQRKRGGGNVFDLEEGDDEVELTHGGKALTFDDEVGDYDAASVAGSSDGEDGGFLVKKRRRESEGEGGEEQQDEEQPERKKSKAEVMKEVIAKSKMHKYERQQQKEDDDELREELDKDLNEVLAALRGHAKKPAAPEPPKDAPKDDFGINPERAAMLAGEKTREEADKEYDARVRQMLYDQRSKPTERTKTDEEKAKEEADRLKKMEERRMRRMRGESVSDSEDEPAPKKKEEEEEDDDESMYDDAAEFGLSGAPRQSTRPDGVEDEDDFELDDQLIASDSEADISGESDDESEDGSGVDDTMAADEDDDFLKDVLPESKKPTKAVNGVLTIGADAAPSKLAYTYSCPRSHEELLKVFKDVKDADIPTVVQRIRALYHAGLHADNKSKLADFACALVDHISYLSNREPAAPLASIESVIRHIHSMSRSYPVQIATQFREHLKALQASDDPTPGHLTILTAIGSIYPTSDHFHQVVTPAITLMAKWLGLHTPGSAKDVATGAYLGALCLHYQRLSKRYVPELIRYSILAVKSEHKTPALLAAHIKNISAAADLWAGTSAFVEVFSPLIEPLKSARQMAATQRLQILIRNAKVQRRPLELHHHRPLPIKQSVPKFEAEFDPNKHYDPDKERAEAARLQKEFKRERKGALRELRKDANFVARAKLQEKKERDRQYEEKYRKLVAEIQGEEGHEAKLYEKEKKARKRKA